MSSNLFGIIDGTGARNDGAYDNAMLNSFCSQLKTQLGAHAFYQRGPSGEGLGLDGKARQAVNFLTRSKTGGRKKLFLAGYSRGCSAALLAAEMLEKKNIGVEGIILFDPVAKHIGHAVKKLPSNVENSLIFIRHVTPELIKKYEGTIPGEWSAFGLAPDWVDNPIRPGWGSYFKNLTNSCSIHHDYRTVVGSHGALGGVGWDHVTEDKKAQNEVANATNAALTRWGVNAKVKALPNNACFAEASRPTLPSLEKSQKSQKIFDAHRNFRMSPLSR